MMIAREEGKHAGIPTGSGMLLSESVELRLDSSVMTQFEWRRPRGAERARFAIHTYLYIYLDASNSKRRKPSSP